MKQTGCITGQVSRVRQYAMFHIPKATPFSPAAVVLYIPGDRKFWMGTDACRGSRGILFT